MVLERVHHDPAPALTVTAPNHSFLDVRCVLGTAFGNPDPLGQMLKNNSCSLTLQRKCSACIHRTCSGMWIYQMRFSMLHLRSRY